MVAVTQAIDLNADLGEDESEAGIARDLEIMKIISSCNIACGGHAGSPKNMLRMLQASKANGVAAGAHPSYPDRENFGRQSLDIAPDELASSLSDQLAAVIKAADKTGVELRHIKPHGALYNDAQDDQRLAEILVELARSDKLALVGMDGSVFQKQAEAADMTFIAEAFIDRRYTEKARLVTRDESGAVLSRDDDRIDQGLNLALGNPIAINGDQSIRVMAQTLCLHSDSDGALGTARKMRATLEQAGFAIQASTL